MKHTVCTECSRNRGRQYRRGLGDGVSIALGYLAVSFSIGIAARSVGLSLFEGFLASLLNNASAGEYAGFTVIAADAPYIETALITLVANARYLLMSCVISQRLEPTTAWYHRLLIGFDLTDELFGVYIAQPGFLDPYYAYGVMSLSIPAWATGTVLGILAGTFLPTRIISALSITLFGMFLAIIIPPCRKSAVMTALVAVSFGCSYLSDVLPVLSDLSDGTRTVILTVLIAAAFALIFPIKQTEDTPDAGGSAVCRTDVPEKEDGHDA